MSPMKSQGSPCSGCYQDENEWFTCDGRNCVDYQSWLKERTTKAHNEFMDRLVVIIGKGIRDDVPTREIAEEVYDSFWSKKK